MDWQVVQLHLVKGAEATVKALPATAPGFMTWLAHYGGLLKDPLTALFMALSVLFLMWRWYAAWKREKNGLPQAPADGD